MPTTRSTGPRPVDPRHLRAPPGSTAVRAGIDSASPGHATFRTATRPFRSTTKYVTCSTATHPETPMATASTSAERVAKRRAALRAQGLRPVQIWVPDTRAPGFAEEYARQAAIADAANRADPELRQIEETVAADIAEHLDALETEQSG